MWISRVTILSTWNTFLPLAAFLNLLAAYLHSIWILFPSRQNTRPESLSVHISQTSLGWKQSCETPRPNGVLSAALGAFLCSHCFPFYSHFDRYFGLASPVADHYGFSYRLIWLVWGEWRCLSSGRVGKWWITGNSKLIEIIRFWSGGLFINILSCLNRKKWNRR